MVNITHKQTSLRKAIATAIVKVSKGETVEAVKNKTVPKGDVFEFSRAAGLLAIKKTSDVIPDCHPLPVEYAAIKHEVDGLNIIITVEDIIHSQLQYAHFIFQHRNIQRCTPFHYIFW